MRVDHAPKLDGSLDDPLWQSAKPVTKFRQREPNEGETATEKTEVRILFSRHAVYFGIHCYDSKPSGIVATELRRDVSQDLDDHFEILIDSNHDRRDAYVFQINPLGTQSDGLIVEGKQQRRRLRLRMGWSVDFRGAHHCGRLDSDRGDSIYNAELHTVEERDLGLEFQAVHPQEE